MSRSNKPAGDQPVRRYKVQTPVDNFVGMRCGVSIQSGVGYTESFKAACECRQLGYTVTDAQTGEPLEQLPECAGDEKNA